MHLECSGKNELDSKTMDEVKEFVESVSGEVASDYSTRKVAEERINDSRDFFNIVDNDSQKSFEANIVVFQEDPAVISPGFRENLHKEKKAKVLEKSFERHSFNSAVVSNFDHPVCRNLDSILDEVAYATWENYDLKRHPEKEMEGTAYSVVFEKPIGLEFRLPGDYGSRELDREIEDRLSPLGEFDVHHVVHQGSSPRTTVHLPFREENLEYFVRAGVEVVGENDPDELERKGKHTELVEKMKKVMEDKGADSGEVEYNPMMEGSLTYKTREKKGELNRPWV